MVSLHVIADAWGEKRCSSRSFLTSALEGGEWSASRPGDAVLPGKGTLAPIMGPRAGLDAEARWKKLYYCINISLKQAVVSR
jgi:hypothetical protein